MSASSTDLVPHPAAAPHGALHVAGTAVLEPRGLRLTFVVGGDTGALVLAAPAARPGRRDRLWEHTCCEAFVGTPDGSAYLELNVSPSGDWALWAFDAQRTGMRAAATVGAPPIRVLRSATEVRCDALVDDAVLRGFLGPPPYRVGLTAVLEEVGGNRAYFACRHVGPNPDFHARDGWTLTVYGPADA
jgi:hypothetical protein